LLLLQPTSATTSSTAAMKPDTFRIYLPRDRVIRGFSQIAQADRLTGPNRGPI
jgi:hypothetical protein